MRKRKIGFHLIFSLFVIVLFSYIYNLIPSKIDRTYECNIFDVNEKRIVGKTAVNIRGKLSKGFFTIKKFDGKVEIEKEIFTCEDLRFSSNTAVMKNDVHKSAIYITTNERKIIIIKFDENLRFKERIITNISGEAEEINQEYYQILNKMNKK